MVKPVRQRLPSERMSRSLSLKLLLFVALGLVSLPATGATWFVRPDGGTRYTQTRLANRLSAQCDGLADAPYPGSGTNRHCAFNDVRFLWGDATANNNQKWVIEGGDTVILRGSIQDGTTYRIGWANASSGLDPKTKDYWGTAGDPYSSGPPALPSGKPGAPTRLLGGNYGHCHDASSRTQLHGGYGVSSVLRLDGSSWVDLECIDITDFSSCGRAAQVHGCNTNPGTLDDYASSGILWGNTSTHDTLQDVSVHGIAGSGMLGPTGDGTVFEYLSVLGNAAAGWNADSGNGTTGTGSLLVRHFNFSWNGCAEQYPMVDALPYADCTDDNVGGYGDGFGSATIPSKPGWRAVFDQGVASYNTQDGLDALHLNGAGSSTTVTNTLAYGNMGQQVKIGGNQAIVRDNTIFANCNALRQPIPGTPSGYNSRLSDFCRAADTGIFISVNDGSTTVFEHNVVYSAGSTMLQVGVNESCGTPSCIIRQSHNTFLGFQKNRANGYPSESTGEYPNPVYIEDALKAYQNTESTFDHNTTFHFRPSWKCPNTRMHEKDATCTDPHRKDETWHLYGFGEIIPAGAGGSTTTKPHAGPVRRPSLLALPCIAALAGLSTGVYQLRRRTSSDGPSQTPQG